MNSTQATAIEFPSESLVAVEEGLGPISSSATDRPTIVFVVHTWFPNHQRLIDELSGLLSYPIRYFVLSSQDRNRTWSGLGMVRVPPVVVPGLPVRVGGLQISLKVSMAKFLEGIRPAAVVTKGWIEPGYYVAQRFARASGVPLVTWFAGRPRYRSISFSGLFLRKVSNLFYGRAVRQSRFVFVYGSRPGDDALKLGVPKDRIVIVRHAIDEPHFDRARNALTETERSQLRRMVGLRTDGPLFLCISQLVPRKGIRDLLNAFGCLYKRRPEVQLLLIGKGSLETIARKYIAKFPGSFSWLPCVPYAGIPRYYALADYFVLTTHFDAWATVINEAHCAKLPVISSDAAHAVDDLVIHGQTGLVYKAGDVAGLIEAMEYALDHPTEMKQMSERGYEFIQSKWNVRESARIWAQHLEIAIRERSR